MKPRSLKWRIILGGLTLLAAYPVVGIFIGIFVAGPRPECGRAIDGAFASYALDVSHTNIYPNIDGNGVASLKLIKPYYGDRIFRYGYVPGLRCDDSKNLLMLYLKEKTRYTYHGDTAHGISSPKMWKVMSPDILSGPDPEGGELVTTAEFKRRMQATLAFLKENQRPNWQAVVAEQTAFLNSIKE